MLKLLGKKEFRQEKKSERWRNPQKSQALIWKVEQLAFLKQQENIKGEGENVDYFNTGQISWYN